MTRAGTLLATTAFLALAAVVPTRAVPAAQPGGPRKIYVSDVYQSQVVIFHGSKQSVVEGADTMLLNPTDVKHQASGDIVVANERDTQHGVSGSIVTLPAGHGDLTAKSVISCDNLDPWGIALDSSSNIWITDDSDVRAYPPDADGCPAPLYQITGSKTQLEGAIAVALDPKARIVVLNFHPDKTITVYAPGSNGNTAPVARIFGNKTQLDQPEGMAQDRKGNIYISDYRDGSILEFFRNANGNVVPMRVISGPHTFLGATIGLAVSRRTGNIYAANLDTSSILVFAASASGDVAPIEQLSGSLEGPSGIALVE